MLVKRTSLKYCYRGGVFSGVLYSVWERTFIKDGVEAQKSERWIGVDLLHCYQGDWGRPFQSIRLRSEKRRGIGLVV